MPITNKGKDAILTNVFNGATLALGTMNGDGKTFTEIRTTGENPNYARMNISVVSSLPSGAENTKLYVRIADGVLTNLNTAYYKDADDGDTKDSLTPQTTGGWADTFNAVAVYRGSTLYYASKFTDNPIHVYQGHRVKIGAGNLQITFTPTEEVSS